MITYVVIDSRTGQLLRGATVAEVAAFHAGQTNPRYQAGLMAFDHPVRVNDTETVDSKMAGVR